jgi:hypothetical protein
MDDELSHEENGIGFSLNGRILYIREEQIIKQKQLLFDLFGEDDEGLEE